MAKYCCDYEAVTSAMTLIRPYVDVTPIMTSCTMDKMSGRKLFFKTENFQKTGSFKIRGATNAVLKIKQNSPAVKCVVTPSSGNNGQALAKAAQIAGLECYVVMTTIAPQCKIDAVKGYGANVVLCEPNEKAMEEAADHTAEKYAGIHVSTGRNSDVIAGEGTIAMEILEQNPDIDVIIAAVGGGGLISGIAIAAKKLKPTIKIIAAEPEKANDCYVSMQKGELTPNPTFPDTIADGVRVSVYPNAWQMIRDLVDDVITVSEDEIKSATLLIWERCKLVIEPSAGVAVAAVLSEKFGRVKGQNVAVVLCGGNVDLNSVSELLN